MAINIPIITEFADQGLKSAQGAFSTFRQKVGEAEGGMGKFKAAGGVAMDSIKANAGAMALGAGAAIAGFAVKAVGDFQKLALSVDEFRNTTGLTLDQSSQWVSYTGDLGIQAESMVKIFNRLGKAATDQLPAFKELGVEIQFGPDGAADLEKTFLRVNDAINSLDDPVAQAKYRADLFGRGWMDAAELINMSSGEITTALQGVKDFEVINEDEIKKAKDLRQAQDELADAFARISVKLGQALIPAFTALLDAATPLLDLLGKIDTEAMKAAGSRGALPLLSEKLDELGLSSLTAGTIIGELTDLFGDNEDAAEDNQLSVEELERAWRDGTRQMIIAADKTQELTEALADSDEALAELKGNVDDRREWDNLIGAIEDAKEAALDAFFEATPEALRESQRETDNARVKVAEYIAQMDEIPDEKKTEMIAALDQANLAEIEAQFNYLARTRHARIVADVFGGELLEPTQPVPGQVPFAPMALRSASAGVTVNVAGSVISQNDLVETVRKGLVNSQRNGAGLVYSNR